MIIPIMMNKNQESWKTALVPKFISSMEVEVRYWVGFYLQTGMNYWLLFAQIHSTSRFMVLVLQFQSMGMILKILELCL